MNNKPIVIMVDDEPDYLAVVRHWLEPEYRFYGYKTGEEFLSSLSAIVPEVVILDLYLLGVDGFELCRRMHAMPGLKSVPVVFLTGSTRVDDYRKSLVAGASSYLMKPVSRSQLLAVIASLLPQPSMQDDGGGD
jgi:putative two-component system response regulator